MTFLEEESQYYFGCIACTFLTLPPSLFLPPSLHSSFPLPLSLDLSLPHSSLSLPPSPSLQRRVQV